MSFRQSGTRQVDSSNSRSSLVLPRAGGAGSGGWGRGWDSGGLEQLSPAQCFEIGPFLQKRMWGWGVSPILLFNPKQQKHKTKSERMKEKQTNQKNQKPRACSQGVSHEGETEVAKGKPNVPRSQIETPCPKPLHLEAPTTKLHLVIVSESSLYDYLSPFVLPEFLLSKLGSMYKNSH